MTSTDVTGQGQKDKTPPTPSQTTTEPSVEDVIAIVEKIHSKVDILSQLTFGNCFTFSCAFQRGHYQIGSILSLFIRTPL